LGVFGAYVRKSTLYKVHMKDSEIKYQAVGDRLLVRPVKFSETLTDSGIILPDEAESKMLSFWPRY